MKITKLCRGKYRQVDAIIVSLRLQALIRSLVENDLKTGQVDYVRSEVTFESTQLNAKIEPLLADGRNPSSQELTKVILALDSASSNPRVGYNPTVSGMKEATEDCKKQMSKIEDEVYIDITSST